MVFFSNFKASSSIAPSNLSRFGFLSSCHLLLLLPLGPLNNPGLLSHLMITNLVIPVNFLSLCKVTYSILSSTAGSMPKCGCRRYCCKLLNHSTRKHFNIHFTWVCAICQEFASCWAYDTAQNIYDPNLMCSTGTDIYIITKGKQWTLETNRKDREEENYKLEFKEDFSKEVAFKQKPKWRKNYIVCSSNIWHDFKRVLIVVLIRD